MKKLLIVVALASLLGSCANTPAPNVADACIYSGKPASTSGVYNETEVGFCCDKCKGRFDGLSSDEQSEMIAKAASR